MDNITYKDINILYEDNHVLVVFKPQNIASCPDISGDPDLLTLMKQYLTETYNKQGEAFLGLVHRLDRPTGGVMVFAKTSKAAMRLSSQIQSGVFEKRYYTITNGVPKQRHAILKNMLVKNEEKNEVYCVPMASEGGKLAVLEYRVLSEIGSLAFLDIRLLTGRSHQVRVQLANIGTPVYGDQKYGQNGKTKNENLALWATELRFMHPTIDDVRVFHVEPPMMEAPWNKFTLPPSSILYTLNSAKKT
ncbi:MAG: RNA pseudouridine synthase [Christensenellaceae bacterium]|jgi:23S rRNA pseudouridine1911/1915/1917 synthase|nr:RNA pseudouridine synthase [Christensenellaceae bacterium]